MSLLGGRAAPQNLFSWGVRDVSLLRVTSTGRDGHKSRQEPRFTIPQAVSKQPHLAARYIVK